MIGKRTEGRREVVFHKFYATVSWVIARDLKPMVLLTNYLLIRLHRRSRRDFFYSKEWRSSVKSEDNNEGFQLSFKNVLEGVLLCEASSKLECLH